jgi:hypothetical protein
VRLILPHAHGLNLRIVRRDLGDQVAQRLVEVEPVEVDHEPVRSLQKLLRVLQRLIRFDGDARVVARGPHTHADHRRCPGEARRNEPEHERGRARPQDLPAPPVVARGGGGFDGAERFD